MRFPIDEDLPRSAALSLGQAGHLADRVRDVGLRGRPDREIFQWAQKHRAVLVTGDMGFASTVDFPPGSHCRIVVLRFPYEASVASVNKELSLQSHCSPKGIFAASLLCRNPAGGYGFAGHRNPLFGCRERKLQARPSEIWWAESCANRKRLLALAGPGPA
ncbi:MAG: DUF5615 family PIN-like protein [Bacillota bacterium]